MKREVQIFLTAVMFYTRIPCPAWIDHDERHLNLSTKYLPVIGWIVGGMYAFTILGAAYLFNPAVSIILGLGVSLLLTGAFHEDGFTDVCDGFGGGWTKERILIIMKDSRIGTYGVVGIVVMLALKLTLTYELFIAMEAREFFLAIVSSHALSRLMPIGVISTNTYAREEQDMGKAKPVATGISSFSLVAAMVFALTPLMFLAASNGSVVLWTIVPMIVVTSYLALYFRKWIGGYTGDCLGAVQQVSETTFLLSIVALWKFI